MDELVVELRDIIRNKTLRWLTGLGVLQTASLTVIQQAMSRMGRVAAESVGAAWRQWLAELTVMLRECPHCGHRRKLKWRSRQPLRVEVLGFTLELPKPYLECGHCTAAGVSVVKLELERTKVRRMALEVEQEAMAFSEAERARQLKRLGGEARTAGVALILTEADGGKVRSGTLVACEEGDKGFGQRTAKRGLPRRKRPSCFREVITMDSREPGATETSAMDVLVPLGAQPGERSRRMLALARAHRAKVLPRELDRCPVAALQTYLTNNWKHMRFAELKALGLPFVSARAECQVRVRTKDRFCTAGAWRLENIEPKATLRSIIADGRWAAFKTHVLAQHRCRFEKDLLSRLALAVHQGRLSIAQLDAIGLNDSLTTEELAA